MFRWVDISDSSFESLSFEDQRRISEFGVYDAVVSEIQSKIKDPKSSPATKRHLISLNNLPQAVVILTQQFERFITPRQADFHIIWGIFYLILKATCEFPALFQRVTDFLTPLRRAIELFNAALGRRSVLDNVRTGVSDFLEILLETLMELHTQCRKQDCDGSWSQLSDSLSSKVQRLVDITKHVSSLYDISKTPPLQLNHDLEEVVLSANDRTETIELVEQHSSERFVLPLQRNTNFYGRQKELDRIMKHIAPNSKSSLGAYTIYGRRGVGKTALALQFAYDCIDTRTYDFVFWVQSETMVSTRQSFASIAKFLHLGRDDGSQDHEILVAVHNWLSKTDSAWLLIFDNIENESILRLYWPVNASRGSVLITSRDYHLFIKKVCIRGDTLKPFESQQSWELLLVLLGKDWKKKYQGDAPQTEIMAGKALLLTLEGLALAIEQTANLIKDEQIGGSTMAGTFETFKFRIENLPEGYSAPRSASERALDTIWAISFQSLTRNSRALLSLMAWFSPDGIPVDMLRLRQEHENANSGSRPIPTSSADGQYLRTFLRSVLTSPSDLQTAITDLAERKLIKTQSRKLTIHRVVQEATYFQSIQSLQDTFDFASCLLFERFPNDPPPNQSLHQQWNLCNKYVGHVLYMSKAFSKYSMSGVLKASEGFIEMLNNASWYLYEIGDYDTCESVIRVALSASSDQNSAQYSRLLLTDGSRLYEQNRLQKCRTVWEECLQIREKLFPNNLRRIANILTNIGNLELAMGNPTAALLHYRRAQNIYLQGDVPMVDKLAVTQLNLGRLYALQGNFVEATKHTKSAELVIQKSSLSFMVHVYYAYGKIYMFQKKWDSARKGFAECLNIGLTSMPTHQITCAAWYSMACLEYIQGDGKASLANLAKAKEIAVIRSPIREDGTLARILWKTAVVLDSFNHVESGTEAAALRRRAEGIKQSLIAAGEGGHICRSHSSMFGISKEEDSYDALVPLFFR